MEKYYYIDDISKQQRGPVLITELRDKDIRPETMVWRSGMADWVRADRVEDLAFLFDSKKTIPQQQEARGYGNVTGTSETAKTTYGNAQQGKQGDVLAMPKNWLLESILLSVLCCSPISVVGIFYASRVESRYYMGDYEGAGSTATKARNWALAGILFIPAAYTLFYLFIRLTAVTL